MPEQPDDYAPFPTAELTAMAETYEQVSHSSAAQVLRDAVKSYEALRERCLLAELRLKVFRVAP